MVALPSEPEQGAFESLGRGAALLIVGTLGLLLLAFVSRVVLARDLSVSAFGDFNLGLSFAGLLSLMALLGLHQAVARTIANERDPAVRRRVVRWAALVTSAAAVLASVSLYLLAGPIAVLFDPAGPAMLTVVFQMLSVTVGLTLLSTLLGSVFQGFEDALPFGVLSQGVQPGSFLVFLGILYFFRLDLTSALLAWVLSSVTTFAALLAYAYRRLPRFLPPGPRAPRLPRGLWTLSISLWGVTTLLYLTGYFDTIVLGLFRPAAAVGVYSAVMTLGRLILIGASAVTFIFLPVSARLWGEGNVGAIRSGYRTAGRWVLVFTTPLFLVFAILPSETLAAIFGPSYGPGALALAVVAGAALASVAFGPVGATLAGLAKTRPLLIATGVSAAVNGVLSFVLIPTYGLLGAALAWSVARIAYPATGAVALARQHGIDPLHRGFLLPLGISLGIGVPLFAAIAIVLSPPMWAIFPLYFLGVGIFLAAILATRSVDPGDLVVVRMAERFAGRTFPRLRRALERCSAGGPGLTAE